MMKVARVLFLAVCLMLLAGAMLAERYEVHRLGDDDFKVVGAPEFVQEATYDSYMRQHARLYDVRSLLPPEKASQKDCKT